MQTEAGGSPGKAAMLAVGWTVLNRMHRNGTASVRDVWGGYQHYKKPEPATIETARQILGGADPDTTDGATHFYTPRQMPHEGMPRHGDTGGGLESVPGVVAGGKPVRNYRPSWTRTFIPKTVAGVRKSDFEFYRQPDDGRLVR